MTTKEFLRQLRRVTGECRRTIGRIGFQLKSISRNRRPSKTLTDKSR